jgi:hypothetical protein
VETGDKHRAAPGELTAEPPRHNVGVTFPDVESEWPRRNRRLRATAIGLSHHYRDEKSQNEQQVCCRLGLSSDYQPPFTSISGKQPTRYSFPLRA